MSYTRPASHRQSTLFGICTVFALLAGLVLFQPAIADTQTSPKPIDLMLIIDNSCSMYEPGNETCGVNALGSDPNFLRVTGASLFAARMSFGQPNPEDRIGAISMGSIPRVVYELKPIEESRIDLAVAVDQPAPTGGTQVINALGLAYSELEQKSDANHKPVVVFLTDGVPVPPEGQSFADIERIVQEHGEIPLYVLLLQNQSSNVPQPTVVEYRAYIEQWKRFAQHVRNVQVYEVPDDEELLLIYNHVMADIIGGPGSLPPITLHPGETKEFFVSRFAQRIYITAIHPDKEHRGTITIVDRMGKELTPGEPGVEVFTDLDNQVEVYSAYGQRLVNQTGGMWKVTSVDATLSFFVDQTGAYRFDWLTPSSTPESFPGVVSLPATNPSETTNCEFRLVDDQNSPILEPQSISGRVIAPDGTESDLPMLSGLAPDGQGVYAFRLRMGDYGPANSKARFEIHLRSDDPGQPPPAQAIAVLTLWIQADSTVAPAVTDTPIPPTPTARPTFTPTVVTTPTVKPVPPPTLPPTPPPPCPNPPFCKPLPVLILWAVLAVAAVLGTLYGLLRIVRKPPRGFVVVVKDGQLDPPRAIQGLASSKFWRWWQLTVGPQGDLRVKPAQNVPGGGAAEPAPGDYNEQARVNIPGLGATVVSAGAGESKTGKKKRKTPANRRQALGRFIYDRGKTRFVNQYNRGTTVLTADAIQTVSFGNVQLRMSLDRTKLV